MLIKTANGISKTILVSGGGGGEGGLFNEREMPRSDSEVTNYYCMCTFASLHRFDSKNDLPPYFFRSPITPVRTVVAQCLRRCATNWKVACSIPEGFIGIFH